MKRLLIALSMACIMALPLGCSSTKAVTPAEIMTGTTWELSSIKGKKAEAANYNKGLPHAIFTLDNKVSGNAGCNQYSGSYNLNDEGGINISQVISTKIFCEGNGENDYLKALQEADAAEVDKDKLVLLKGVDEVLVFVPKK